MEIAQTRRSFLFETAAAAGVTQAAVARGAAGQTRPNAGPWYRRTLRWGQTNLTERDPERYDAALWREYWKRTRIQGVIVNAGGIVAYYPSKFPLHRRAEFLGGRDLFGEISEAAHSDGLAVLARMDSNRAGEEFYRAHPGWFACDASGAPYRAGDKYISCIHGPYYEEYIPSLLVEIAERYRPEGFTDNSWSGLGRDRICYCDNCARSFRDQAGSALPARADWDDAVYRKWIEWSYARRLAVWDLNNRATKGAGGPDCIWTGMNSGSITGQSQTFRDYKAICERAELIFLDHQTRSEAGFAENAAAGKLIHGLLGWDKLIPESMAMYQAGRTPFRLSAKPAAEARMWMLEGIAGGIEPWWHHVGAYHEDRRAYRTAEPVLRWHEANEAYLVKRRPVAAVGVVWSQRNTDYYGRGEARERVELPYRGMTQALVRARIPFIPVHADHVERDGGGLAALILPNVAAMSDEQCAAVRRFVERGGGLIASGAASLYDEWGDSRGDFALAELFGAHAARGDLGRAAAGSFHTYLRVHDRALLKGFEETAILPYGGMVEPVRAEAGAAVPLTFIPPFPVYPPETAWMREPETKTPALVLNGRVAYLAADIDRRYAKDGLPDHGDLLANLVRWAAAGRIPLEVEGRGLVDCNLYAQPGRMILHVVNLTGTAGSGPVEDVLPAGPFTVRMRLPRDVSGRRARLLVSGGEARVAVKDGWAAFVLPRVGEHEVAVVE
ncbi:MAG: beta-galactosidase [Acidobacteriota bacterium]